VVVELDTPGGSFDAMKQISTAFLEARVPVIVWVAPAGGRAASAGTFITLAANLSYMAPGTNIGAASPVDASGQDITGTEGLKVRNDAIAKITSIAETRGRPVAWAVSTVESAASYTANAAVAAGAVDGIADSLDAVLAQANGRSVGVMGHGTVTLALTGATTSDLQMNPILGLLHLLSDPNIAFLLFVLGALGVGAEFVHPNLLSGITGTIALILAFVGFGSLPLNVAGLLLVATGIFLFVLETQIVSHGLLTAAGLVAFVLGASALYTRPIADPTEPLVQVATPVIVVAAITMALFMGLIAVSAVRIRTMLAPAGSVGTAVAAGSEGIVQAPLAPLGTVQLAGEAWSARTADGRVLERGAPVRLVHFDRLVAVVAPIEPAPGTSRPSTPSQPPEAQAAATTAHRS
jgi:membrane-bound serine protease (ClpP class)